MRCVTTCLLDFLILSVLLCTNYDKLVQEGGEVREREPMTQTMKASQVRQEWSKLLNTVFRGKTRVVVEKSGIPVAAIISAEDLERLKQFEAQRAERLTVLQDSWAAFKEEDPETIEREVAQAVAEVREERRQEQQGDATVA